MFRNYLTSETTNSWEICSQSSLKTEEGDVDDDSVAVAVDDQVVVGEDCGDEEGDCHDDEAEVEYSLLSQVDQCGGYLRSKHDGQHEGGEDPAQGHLDTIICIKHRGPEKDKDVHG